MKLVITYQRDMAAFLVQTIDVYGGQLSALATTDPAVLLREVQIQLLRMRHLAQGKVLHTPQPRSGA